MSDLNESFLKSCQLHRKARAKLDAITFLRLLQDIPKANGLAFHNGVGAPIFETLELDFFDERRWVIFKGESCVLRVGRHDIIIDGRACFGEILNE